MSLRQIILDTETTGLRVEEGHRIIEIGCIEMINRKLTGQHFHYYLNPERQVEAGALTVHGITNEFLLDKPTFSQIAEELMNFILGAELVIHNAPFDLSFLNNELALLNATWKSITDHCAVIDTLQMARKLHVGQRNSLDALCKRYGIDNSKRELHGALLDAHLLAQVYLIMTGGQGNFFDSMSSQQISVGKSPDGMRTEQARKYQFIELKASKQELNEHESYLQSMKKRGKCRWLDE